MVKVHLVADAIKKECGREQCGFDHTPADDFVKSQWQNRTKSSIYLLYRWLLALFFMAVVIESMACPDQPGQFWLYFIYLTNWGILLCLLTNLYGAILVTIWHYHPEYADKLLNLQSLASPFRFYWSLHVTSLVVSIVITVVYWSILYKGDGSVSATNILTHAFNSGCMFVDFLIVAHPLRLLHIFLPVAFGTVYATFSIIYHSFGGHNKLGKPFIYHVIDWNQPSKATVTVITILLFTCVVYMLLFTVYKLKMFIYRRLNNTSFMVPAVMTFDLEKAHHENKANVNANVNTNANANLPDMKPSPSGVSTISGTYSGYRNPAFHYSEDERRSEKKTSFANES